MKGPNLSERERESVRSNRDVSLVLAAFGKVILVSGQVKVGKVPAGLPPLEVPKDKSEQTESISNTSEHQQTQQQLVILRNATVKSMFILTELQFNVNSKYSKLTLQRKFSTENKEFKIVMSRNLVCIVYYDVSLSLSLSLS